MAERPRRSKQDKQGDYYNLRLLGEGAFGKVYLMRHVPSQRLVCVKALKEGKGMPLKELQVMQQLTHPCLIRFEDSFHDAAAGMLFIIMQYCDRGDLAGKLKDAKRSRVPFAEAQLWEFFGQLSLAVEYMHARKVIHRDIKPPNIFLMGPEERLVLGDVGVAKSLENTMAFAHTGIGTPCYMAPEIFSNKGHNTKADVWSLGVLLYELAYLCQPFEGASVQEIGSKVISGRYRPIPAEDSHRYSSAVGDMVLELLNVNPERRPSVADLLRTRPMVVQRAQEYGARLLAIEDDNDVSPSQREALAQQTQGLWGVPSVTAAVTGKTLFSSSSAKTTTATKEDDNSKLQAILEKLRQERTARLENSLRTLSLSEHEQAAEHAIEELLLPPPPMQQERGRSVHFSESQEQRNAPVTPTTTPRAVTTALDRLRESQAFLVQVLGEETFNEARRRAAGQGEGWEEVFVESKAKYLPLFSQLLSMEASLSQQQQP